MKTPTPKRTTCPPNPVDDIFAEEARKRDLAAQLSDLTAQHNQIREVIGNALADVRATLPDTYRYEYAIPPDSRPAFASAMVALCATIRELHCDRAITLIPDSGHADESLVIPTIRLAWEGDRKGLLALVRRLHDEWPDQPSRPNEHNRRDFFRGLNHFLHETLSWRQAYQWLPGWEEGARIMRELQPLPAVNSVPAPAQPAPPAEVSVAPHCQPLTLDENDRAVQPVVEKQRPCYSRDHLWLKWADEGMGPAAIRDKWNEEYPDHKVGNGESGRDRVKKGLNKARKE